MSRLLVDSDTLLRTLQSDPLYFAYLKGSGMDYRTNGILSSAYAKQSLNIPTLKVPRWFPLYFPTSLTRYLRLPYTVRINDILSQLQNDRQQLQFLSQRTAATGETISLPKVYGKPKPIPYPTETDATLVQDMIKKVITQYDVIRRTKFASDPSQVMAAHQQTIAGKFQENTADKLTSLQQATHYPLQYIDTEMKSVSKLGNVLPYVNLRQAAQLLNFTMGKDAYGQPLSMQRDFYTYTPLVDVAQYAAQTPRPKEVMQDFLSKQIRQQKLMPAGSYMRGAKEIAKQMALESKYSSYVQQQIEMKHKSKFSV